MIHPTAEISQNAKVGPNTRIWAYTQVGDGARIGADCIIGRGVYVDRGVVVGDRVKIQTGAQLYRGVVVDDGVFIGPLVCLTNDKYPRAITVHGLLKSDADWEMGKTQVHYGASLGAGAVVLPGLSVGRFAMIGAGSVVVADVPDHGLVTGVPGQLIGYACQCGRPLRLRQVHGLEYWECSSCGAVHLRLADQRLCLSQDGGAP